MTFTITELAGEYTLLNEESIVVRVDADPRRLSNWAFDHGAEEVRHEYDLVKAEIIPWTQKTR